MKIESVATIGKGLTVKREKTDDESEKIVAHLKFTDCFVSREEIDLLCQQRAGWARETLFDELGAPLAKLELGLIRTEYTASVMFSNGDGDEMHVAGAVLSSLVLLLDKSGAVLSGALAWEAAGDETSDAEAFLGQMVKAQLNLTGAGQRDLLAAAP